MMVNLSQLMQTLKQDLGMDFSMVDGTFLRNSIEKRMQETDCCSAEDYGICLQQNQNEGKLLSDSLHIHVSEFFRNPLTFAVLERLILPELMQKKKAGRRKEIRIWSAGCAAGQEAYSIAILLEEMLANAPHGLNYRIFATDLDETPLAEARLGHYAAATLSNLSLKRAQTWFTRQGESYVVQPSIRQHVDFSIFDLLEEGRGSPPASIFGDFDLVFCCNLLIYYRPEYRGLILDKFAHCLTRSGTLITDETERAIALAHHYCEIYPQAAIFRLNQGKGKLL